MMTLSLGHFLILGAATLCVGLGVLVYFRGQERGLPYARATLHRLQPSRRTIAV